MFFKLLGSKYFLLKFVLISFSQKLTLNSPLCVGKLLIIYLQHVRHIRQNCRLSTCYTSLHRVYESNS